MRELSFMGPSNDGKRLLLVAEDGTQFELPVDSRLISVVSREHGPAVRQPSAVGTAKMPSPREIQDQVRHGSTVEQIAEAAGVSVDDIARFAYPVITERAHIADQARVALVKVGADQVTLESAVLDRIKTRAVDTRLVRWDAWRSESNVWTVIAAYPANQGERIATFTYQSATKTVTANDDEARWILEVGEAQAAKPASAPEPVTRPRPHVVPDRPEQAVVASTERAQHTPPAPTAAKRAEQARPESASQSNAPQGGQPKSWDRAHPAARAHERREANGSSHPADADKQESTRVNPEHPAGGSPKSQDAPAAGGSTSAKAPEPAPAAPKPKKEETPQWEELLFGSPQHDDSN